jgi:hypothetical protein
MAGFARHKQETFTVADNLATNVAALTATSGVDISNAKGVTAVLAAESTRTITGGALRCYVYQPITANKDGTAGTWIWTAYNSLDVTTLTSTVAERCFPIGDQLSLSGIGRIVWLPDGVTVSAGTTCVICYSTRQARS